MYGYYDMGWMLYALVEIFAVWKYQIFMLAGVFILGISRGIRISTSDLLDIKYLLIN